VHISFWLQVTCDAVGKFRLDWSELRLKRIHNEDYLRAVNYGSHVEDLEDGDHVVHHGEVDGLDTVWLLLTTAMIFTAQVAHVAIVNGKQVRSRIRKEALVHRRDAA
jgi:hypothetical protein